MLQKNIPMTLNSYDLLKVAALLLMIVDHIGYYFFPEDNWPRVFGRLCVPVWCFLIGYARTRDFDFRMLLATFFLFLANFYSAPYVMPLSILLGMLITRLVIDRVANAMLKNVEVYSGLIILFTFLILPTGLIVEYGSLILLFALLGWLVRAEQDGHEKVTKLIIYSHIAACTVVFTICQQLNFGFDNLQTQVLMWGTLLVSLCLRHFHMVQFAGTDRGLAGLLSAPLKWAGRHTLIIYLCHLLIFKYLGTIVNPDFFVVGGGQFWAF
jgi:hypothetical protein